MGRGIQEKEHDVTTEELSVSFVARQLAYETTKRHCAWVHAPVTRLAMNVWSCSASTSSPDCRALHINRHNGCNMGCKWRIHTVCLVLEQPFIIIQLNEWLCVTESTVPGQENVNGVLCQ